MHLFGRIAAFVVGILLACGASIALLLIKDFNTLLNTLMDMVLLLRSHLF